MCQFGLHTSKLEYYIYWNVLLYFQRYSIIAHFNKINNKVVKPLLYYKCKCMCLFVCYVFTRVIIRNILQIRHQGYLQKRTKGNVHQEKVSASKYKEITLLTKLVSNRFKRTYLVYKNWKTFDRLIADYTDWRPPTYTRNHARRKSHTLV